MSAYAGEPRMLNWQNEGTIYFRRDRLAKAILVRCGLHFGAIRDHRIFQNQYFMGL